MKSLNRRKFIQSLGAAAAAATAALTQQRLLAQPASRERKLNLVIFVSDDQRHDTIAALGNDHIRTPNMDRLAKTGFALRGARMMGAQQSAVCTPTRAMLNTGRTLFHVPGNLGNFQTLGQTLQAAGYRAFAAGKWHNYPPAFARSFNGGANIFFGGMNYTQYKMPVHDFNPAGLYPNSATHIGDKFSSELFADPVVDFIEHRGKEWPFFCYLAFTSPHDPRTPPPPFSTMYDSERMPLPKNWLPQHPFDNGELAGRDEKLAPFPRTEADTRKQLCDYYSMISSQDAQIGRVLKALDDRGLTEETIVVCTGDHGLAIGSHGLFGKQNIYDHSQRIPMIFSGPGIPKAGSSDACVYGSDVFPTVCDLLGVAPPKSVEGKSLTGLFAGREAKVHDSVFHAYDHFEAVKKPGDKQVRSVSRGINDGRWKYHHYAVNGKTTLRLFDLQNDPDEIHDLSQDRAAEKELPRLAAMLAQKRRELDDDQAD